MKKDFCPRSGLAHTWAPRLRTIFCIFLCILILFLSDPIGAFASSNVQMYDYNGFVAPQLPFSLSDYPNSLICIDNDSNVYLYRFVITSSDRYCTISYSSVSVRYSFTCSYNSYYKYSLTDTGWVYNSSSSSGSMTRRFYSSYDSYIASTSTDKFFIYWSAFDIYDSRVEPKNLVFAGSVPVPVQTQSTDYFITTEGNVNDLYTGESLQFYCQTSEGIQAESVTWSIQNASNYNGLSISDTGLFSVSADSHSIGSVTVQASDINGTYTFTTFDLTIFEGENPDSGGGEGGEGGDTPTPTPIPDASNQDVIDSIDDGFSNLGNKLEDTGNNIINGLLDGLLRLFVPTSEELSQKMDDFKAWIDEKIPILAVPVAFVQYTYDMFFGVTPELGILTFPEIKWMDNVLIQQTELNFSQYSWLNDLLPIIRTVMTAGCCLAFIHWIVGKVKEVGHS